MIPNLDRQRVIRWIESRNAMIPDDARSQIRYELDLSTTSVTVLECRPPWRPENGTEWTRFPIARLRYTKAIREWSLYWRDRNLKFHLYDVAPPSPHVGDLLAQVDRDPTAIFWG